MTPLAWLLLAGAVLLAPSAAAPAPSAAGHVPVAGRAARASRLPALAAVAVGAAGVALFGPITGAVVAAVAAPAVLLGARHYARRHANRRDATLHPSVALVLDLTAAALRAGRPPAEALGAAAPAAPPAVAAVFDQVAGLLRLGAEPGRAWSTLARHDTLGPVATVAIRSAASGARLAIAFERLAAELRAEGAAKAAGRAQRAGVFAMAPLGACFLPSFVLLGVVPVVVGMGRTVLTGVA